MGRERISIKAVRPCILSGANARWATETDSGSATTIPAGHAYGEAIELRYNVADADSQFQAIFVRVAAAAGAAQTSTLRGGEFDARNETNQDSGTIEGVYGTATVKGTGTATAVFGVDGNVSMDADVAHTITTLAALRGKMQVEDAATLTKSYGVLAEMEAVTGNRFIDAYFGARSTPVSNANGAKAAVDVSEARLEVVNTNQVRLMAFTDSAGTRKELVYDPDNATVVAVANYTT